MGSRISSLRSNGPFFVAQSWGPQPRDTVACTSSARVAKASLAAFAQAKREQGMFADSRYRMLRCVDREAAGLALDSSIGTTPRGCEHVIESDL